MELSKKRLSRERKFSILQEHFEKGTSISQLARLNNIHPVTLYQWKKKMSDEDPKKEDIKELVSEVDLLKKENERLLKLIGKAKLDIDLRDDVIDFYKKKTRIQLSKEQESSLKKAREKKRKK